MESYTWLQENYDLDAEEAACIEWQFRFCGDFKTALWQAIQLADGSNQLLLFKVFSVEVRAYKQYTRIYNWWTDIEEKIEKHHPCHREAIDQFNRTKVK